MEGRIPRIHYRSTHEFCRHWTVRLVSLCSIHIFFEKAIEKKKTNYIYSYITLIFLQYGGLLSVRNRRVSILSSNPLWGPRRNLAVPVGMAASALIGVINLYGPGLQRVFATTPIPSKFWGIPFAFALAILIMDETRKLIVRSYPKVCFLNCDLFFFLSVPQQSLSL